LLKHLQLQKKQRDLMRLDFAPSKVKMYKLILSNHWSIKQLKSMEFQIPISSSRSGKTMLIVSRPPPVGRNLNSPKRQLRKTSKSVQKL
jgi:hypothetical protein